VRILLIEDHQHTAAFIRKAMLADGFAVDVCGNGDDGLAACLTTPYDAVVLDTISRQARRGDQAFELTAREYRQLEFLMRSAGRICTRTAILERLWDYDSDPGSNIVDVYSKRLREKFDAGFETRLFHTVRGVGYVLKETP